jgi:hypothetical protein
MGICWDFNWLSSCGQTQRGHCFGFFPPYFLGRLKGGLFGTFFSLFFWHNFLISYKGTHLRDLFQGLGLPLFGLRAHLTKFLVALIGPFWCTLKLLGTPECFVLWQLFGWPVGKEIWKTSLNPIHLGIFKP